MIDHCQAIQTQNPYFAMHNKEKAFQSGQTRYEETGS